MTERDLGTSLGVADTEGRLDTERRGAALSLAGAESLLERDAITFFMFRKKDDSTLVILPTLSSSPGLKNSVVFLVSSSTRLLSRLALVLCSSLLNFSA